MITASLGHSDIRILVHGVLRELWEIRGGRGMCVHDLRSRHVFLRKGLFGEKGIRYVQADSHSLRSASSMIVGPGQVVDAGFPKPVQAPMRVGSHPDGFETVKALVQRADGLQVVMAVFVGESLTVPDGAQPCSPIP